METVAAAIAMSLFPNLFYLVFSETNIDIYLSKASCWMGVMYLII